MMATDNEMLDDKAKRMERAVALVPKLTNILRARGMPVVEDDGSRRFDFAEVEKELRCPLPADYKALIVQLPKYLEWGLDPFSLLDPPDIMECIRYLRGAFWTETEEENEAETSESSSPPAKKPRKSEAGVELDWQADKCFVPFGKSPSAFYLGWIKSNKDDAWQVVQLDSENSLEYHESEWDSRADIPLVEVLYRVVVRAVTPELYTAVERTSVASYFLDCSEAAAEEQESCVTKYARDGSQDHAASNGRQLVVLGRAIVFLPHSPDNDEEEDDDDDDDDTEDLPRQSVFDGASKEDFMGVGVYNVTHPLDVEAEKHANRVANAERQRAVLDIPTASPLSRLETSLLESMEPAVRQAVETAAAVSAVMDVCDMGCAVILQNGKLAVTNRSLECRLWTFHAANRVLDDSKGEVFVQVALADTSGIALTSQNRILQWDRQQQEEATTEVCAWVNFGEEAENNKKKIVRLCGGQQAVAAVLDTGCVWFWGKDSYWEWCPAPAATKPEAAEQPFLLPNVQDVIDVSFGGRSTTFLHKDGTVTLYQMPDHRQKQEEDGAETNASAPLPKLSFPNDSKIVALHDAGDHQLFVASTGAVYGMGGQAEGQLPQAVTKEALAAYDKASIQFRKDAKALSQQIDVFRKSILEHAKNCTQSPPLTPDERKEADAKSMDDFDDETKDPAELSQALSQKLWLCTFVNGFQHLPEVNGAPARPKEWETSVPVPPARLKTPGGQEPQDTISPADVDTPTLLTVGPEHGQKHAQFDGETDETAWNCVKGPYGVLPPGSFAPVVHVSGGYRHSIFVHSDGSLSSCGGEGLSLGLQVSEEHAESEQVPVIARHVRASDFVSIYGKLGMPVAVSIEQQEEENEEKEPTDNIFLVCVKAERGGGVAVDRDGKLWACGEYMGSAEPTGAYVPLEVLTLEENGKKGSNDGEEGED